jgi:hypothetical protein
MAWCSVKRKHRDNFTFTLPRFHYQLDIKRVKILYGGPRAWRLVDRLTTPNVKKKLVRCYTGPRTGSCEPGNEQSGSIKGGEFRVVE